MRYYKVITLNMTFDLEFNLYLQILPEYSKVLTFTFDTGCYEVVT